MMDIDLFLTALYVEVDAFLKTQSVEKNPGPDCKLTKSEAMTLLIFSQWRRFSSERDFYRFASAGVAVSNFPETKLLSAFPNLPSREQLNRQFRHLHSDVCNFFQYLADNLNADDAPYEALDASAVVTRDCKRRGFGWLFSEANIGYSNRLGWFEGLKLLLATTPDGVMTGFGLATASEKNQPMAETFFYLRNNPSDNGPEIRTSEKGIYYPVEFGFEGKKNHQRWRDDYNAYVICPPKRNAQIKWPKKLRGCLKRVDRIVLFG